MRPAEPVRALCMAGATTLLALWFVGGMIGAAEQLEAFAGNGPGGVSQGLGDVDVSQRRGVITCIRCGAPATNFCSACGART